MYIFWSRATSYPSHPRPAKRAKITKYRYLALITMFYVIKNSTKFTSSYPPVNQ